ncbi:hypothetical protein MED222_05610 [Vibrio sp. MED222]|nr:hypothetical protein MED222_05610 [Vibrio sp. MED222]
MNISTPNWHCKANRLRATSLLCKTVRIYFEGVQKCHVAIFPNYVAFERMKERLHLRIISTMTWTIHTRDNSIF